MADITDDPELIGFSQDLRRFSERLIPLLGAGDEFKALYWAAGGMGEKMTEYLNAGQGGDTVVDGTSSFSRPLMTIQNLIDLMSKVEALVAAYPTAAHRELLLRAAVNIHGLD